MNELDLPTPATLEAAGRNYARFSTLSEAARLQLTVAIRAARLAGVSESEIARRAGVSRVTVRKHLGK